MQRIIIEDMKVHKKNNPTILKKKLVSSVDISPNKNFYKEEIKKEKEIEEIKEKEIEEYYKNRNTGKQRISRTPSTRRKPKRFIKTMIVLFVICFIFFGIYFGGNILEKATVTIIAKHQILNYNNKPFNASRDQFGNSVNFEIMIISDKKPKNIILTDSKEVSIKATGSITLYNEFSLNPQKLAAGTFLIDKNGLTYKTNTAVTIPGYKNDADKKIIPGKIEVDISSFLPGENYNGSPSDFYINSFKNTPKYNKIYGKLKDPLTGGAQGMVYTLNDSDKTKLNNLAQSYLREDLMRQVESQIPPNYMLYPNAVTFSYEIDDNFVSKTPEADVPINGKLSALLLDKKSLIDSIIKVSLPNVAEDELKEIKILDLDKLSFLFTKKDQLVTKDLDIIPFYLTGEVNVVWNPDVESLKSKLMGVNKGDVLPIFKQDKGIASALVEIFPVWKNYIPKNTSKINIIVK